MKHDLASPLCAWALLTAAGAAAAAGLDGTSATLRYDYGALPSTIDIWTVGPGAEATCTGGGFGTANVCSFLNAAGATQTVDLGGLTITYANADAPAAFSPGGPGLPNAFNFINLSPGFAIGGVALDTDIAGLGMGRIGFTATSVSVDMQGLQVGAGQHYTLTLQPVPEPASLLLWGAGLALLVGTRAVRRPA